MDNTVNWQAVRDHVAVHVMGWRKQDGVYPYWYRSLKNGGKEIRDPADWSPDTDGGQCFMVIEAMEAAGWNYTLIGQHGYNCNFWRPDPVAVIVDSNGTADTVRQAATLAAAYATGYTDD